MINKTSHSPPPSSPVSTPIVANSIYIINFKINCKNITVIFQFSAFQYISTLIYKAPLRKNYILVEYLQGLHVCRILTKPYIGNQSVYIDRFYSLQVIVTFSKDSCSQDSERDRVWSGCYLIFETCSIVTDFLCYKFYHKINFEEQDLNNLSR